LTIYVFSILIIFQEPGGIEIVIPPTWMVSGIQLIY